jgi:hypothetical protein
MVCPFCKETIKDDAIKCKHCSSDLTEHIRRLKTEKNNVPRHMKWIAWIILLLLLPSIYQALSGTSKIQNKPSGSSATSAPQVSDKFTSMSPAEHLEYVIFQEHSPTF